MNLHTPSIPTTQFEVFEKTNEFVLQIKTKITGVTLGVTVLEFTDWKNSDEGYLEGQLQLRGNLIVLIAGFSLAFNHDQALQALASAMHERAHNITNGKME